MEQKKAPPRLQTGEKKATAKKSHYCDKPDCVIRPGEEYINYYTKKPGQPFNKKKYHAGHRQDAS